MKYLLMIIGFSALLAVAIFPPIFAVGFYVAIYAMPIIVLAMVIYILVVLAKFVLGKLYCLQPVNGSPGKEDASILDEVRIMEKAYPGNTTSINDPFSDL